MRPGGQGVLLDQPPDCDDRAILALIALEPFLKDVSKVGSACFALPVGGGSPPLSGCARGSPRLPGVRKGEGRVGAKAEAPELFASGTVKIDPGLAPAITDSQGQSGIAFVEHVDLPRSRRLQSLYSRVGETVSPIVTLGKNSDREIKSPE